METIGFVDKSWRPPKKSKLEMQIEREDAMHWAQRREPVADFYYSPQKLQLTETAKHVFGSAVHFISSMRKL